jgi:uncharacterized protein
MIEVLTASNYRKMLWKNGEGYTLEIARSEGDDLDEFDWRISMADVKTSGKFSKFNGMHRFLTVLEGQGIVLDIMGELKLLKTHQSIAFDGGSDVDCKLLAGQIRDFNLIYNPKKFSAQYQWTLGPEQSQISILSDLIFIFNHHEAPLEIAIDQKIFYLQPYDSLKIENEKTIKMIILDQRFLGQTCLIQLKKTEL